MEENPDAVFKDLVEETYENFGKSAFKEIQKINKGKVD
jgi:hypothetical protein